MGVLLYIKTSPALVGGGRGVGVKFIISYFFLGDPSCEHDPDDDEKSLPGL
jgi:hypothetical protein